MNNSQKFGIQHYVDMLERDNWSRKRAEDVLENGFLKDGHRKKMMSAMRSKDNKYPSVPWHGRFNRKNFEIAFLHVFDGEPLPVMHVTSRRIQSKRIEVQKLESENEEAVLDARIAKAKEIRDAQVAKAKAERVAERKADEAEAEPEVAVEEEVEVEDG